MKKILYISWCMPYDSVQHAGGQDLNRYIKEISKESEVKLVAAVLPGEEQYSTVEKYGIEPFYVEFGEKGISLDKVLSINSKINPWHKYGNIISLNHKKKILKKLSELKNMGYTPDLIVMQWTQIIMLIDDIKKIFPKSKYVAVEVDVTYLRLEREYKNKKGLNYIYHKISYVNEKKRELYVLEKCDLVFVNNNKDKDLLLKEKIDKKKIRVLIPFYQRISVDRKKTNSDIMFYGHMKRPENYLAAIWFLENVFPLLHDIDTRFVIVGGGADMLEKYKSDRVVVTGYVPQIDQYFDECGVFVAPLTYGAGIKVKVLEAMFSGIPVITSEVGIEGIPAVSGIDYLLYNSTDELVEQIKKCLMDKQYGKKIGINGKTIIENNFNYEIGVKAYIEEILNL